MKLRIAVRGIPDSPGETGLSHAVAGGAVTPRSELGNQVTF